MKPGILISFITCLIILYLAPSSLYAEEDSQQPDSKMKEWTVSIGATAYFAVWEPVWKSYNENSIWFKKGKYRTDQAWFLYGPVVAVAFNSRWGMSGSFLYGDFSGTHGYRFVGLKYFPTYPTGPIPVSHTRSTKKYDADLLATCRLHQWIKLFFGAKYQGYEYHNVGFETAGIGYLPVKEDVVFHSGGLGVGIATTFPLGKGFFFMLNGSFLTLAGRSTNRLYRDTSVAFGTTAVANFGYEIRAIHATVSLGGRLNYLYYYRNTTRYYDNPHDMFYGGNLTVIFTF